MDNPIGVFDSGIGGLTVVKHINRMLPDENLVYFGDTARVPYGTRSKKLIMQYALEDAAFLRQFDIKLLIVACNTASAIAIDLLKKTLDIPVTGVIVPGVEAALSATSSGRIGIIGTTATVNSQAYERRLKSANPNIEAFSQPCPLLIPLVEEGWIEEAVTYQVVEKYLRPVLEKNVDTLILGCTHFPVLANVIAEVVGPGVRLIDSGEETARVAVDMLGENGYKNMSGIKKPFSFYVSDIPDKFDEIGTRFLGEPVVNAQRIDFEQFLLQAGKSLYEPLNATGITR